MFSLDILTIEDGTDWLSQNYGMEMPYNDAYDPRSEQVSKHVQIQRVCQEKAKWLNINVFCDIISENV